MFCRCSTIRIHTRSAQLCSSMSTAVGVKLGSLVIRTLSKPIANAIKNRARDHPRFRKLCIRIAQAIHRADMRVRLSILKDSAAIEKHEAIEKATQHSASKHSTSTAAAATDSASGASASSASTSSPLRAASSPKGDGHSAGSSTAHSTHTSSTSLHPKYHIRPLSEAKAIERGANFISEFFIFTVAGSLILFEAVRSRRKEAARRDIIAERLELLEERSTQDEARIKELEEEVWKLKGGKPEELKVVEPSPLWEGMVKKTGVFGELWQKVIGKKEVKADEISTAEISSSTATTRPRI